MPSRRDFLKSALAVGAGLSLASRARLLGADAPAASAAAAKPGALLVAVREGDRAALLDRAIAELGGMKAFVRPGQKVVIKPNIGWDTPPERGADTHPDFVRRLVVLCQEAGAQSVSIFDNPADNWQRAYANSGMEQVARETGAALVNGRDETLYRDVAFPAGVKLQSARVHSLVLESDVFINVPILKVHSGTIITGALKNLMGCVWDRGAYHRLDLHQCIADFVTRVRPTLNVLDAYAPMVRNGPRGRSPDDLVVMRTLLASTDPVAVDAAGARLLGHAPSEIRHVAIAAGMGLGRMDLENLDIRRIKLG